MTTFFSPRFASPPPRGRSGSTLAVTMVIIALLVTFLSISALAHQPVRSFRGTAARQQRFDGRRRRRPGVRLRRVDRGAAANVFAGGGGLLCVRRQSERRRSAFRRRRHQLCLGFHRPGRPKRRPDFQREGDRRLHDQRAELSRLDRDHVQFPCFGVRAGFQHELSLWLFGGRREPAGPHELPNFSIHSGAALSGGHFLREQAGDSSRRGHDRLGFGAYQRRPLGAGVQRSPVQEQRLVRRQLQRESATPPSPKAGMATTAVTFRESGFLPPFRR